VVSVFDSEAGAAKTWATTPPLKTALLTGSMVSGARKT
jgi:hypothetical protein